MKLKMINEKEFYELINDGAKKMYAYYRSSAIKRGLSIKKQREIIKRSLKTT